MRDVIRSSFSKAALVALALGYGPLPVSALEFGFAAPGASDSFEARLRDASLSLSTARLEGSTAQDLLAAAQADYGRLVGVLYAQGFYSGRVNIRVNGQEAASIPPLRAPERIDRIDIIVDRGPVFAFGRARVAPLAPGTKLPEGFATGLTAKGELIGQAARIGISAWRDAGHAKAEARARMSSPTTPPGHLTPISPSIPARACASALCGSSRTSALPACVSRAFETSRVCPLAVSTHQPNANALRTACAAPGLSARW